jgi:hypothetical protein
MFAAPPGPSATNTPRRDQEQPQGPHRRGRTSRLARRSRGSAGQPRRSQRQNRPIDTRLAALTAVPLGTPRIRNESVTLMNRSPSGTTKFREACLSCGHFATDATHLAELRQQLAATETLIGQRRDQYRQRSGHARPHSPTPLANPASSPRYASNSASKNADTKTESTSSKPKSHNSTATSPAGTSTSIWTASRLGRPDRGR